METMMSRVHGPILAIELYGPKNGYYRSYLMDTLTSCIIPYGYFELFDYTWNDEF